MPNASHLSRMLRVLLAVAVACSWLLLAGSPAGALVTDARVESPKAGAALKRAQPLIVAVDTAPPEEMRVFTRLFYGGTPGPPEPEPSEEPSPESDGDGAQVQQENAEQENAQQEQQPGQLEPVSKKVLELKRLKKNGPQPQVGQTHRFGGLIDPYALGWMPKGSNGVAPNGQYTLEYLADSEDPTQSETWRRFEFRIDARPPQQGAPGVGTQDPAAKQMVVAWQPNFAPDITGYRVERRLGSGKWRVAQDKIKPKTSQITDRVNSYGTYRYRVTAIRPAGDGSDDVRTTTSASSAPFVLQRASQVQPPDTTRGDGTDGTGDDTTNPAVPPVSSGDSSGGSSDAAPFTSPGSSNGFGTQTDDAQEPGVAPPPGFEDTFEGPLDYNVQQDEVTERVPVEVAQPATTQDGGTLEVLNRSIDEQRVLPPLAGGLILVLSAAHVLRYLNE